MKAGERLARDRNIRDAFRDAEARLGGAWQQLSRRRFLKLTGLAGGGLTLAACGMKAEDPAPTTQPGKDFEINEFVNISSDGTILIYSKIPEIGQGIKTAFPMIVAEELDADWKDVVVEQARIDTAVYGRQRAGGSRSVATAWNQLREAGATARHMLVQAAAETWQVPVAECSTANSVVIHASSGRRLAYGALADTAAQLPVPDKSEIVLKSRQDYALLGKRITGVDNDKVVTGQPLFGIDQSLPGMVYASYSKCPATGGRVDAANLDDIRALPGIHDAFILEGNDTVSELMPGVAIIGDSTWATQQAREGLSIDWDETEASKDSSRGIAAEAARLAKEEGAEILHEFGDAEQALARAEQTVEAFYSYPFLSHAPLEPQNCTAWYRDGAIEIWAPTQSPAQAIDSVANVLGIPREKITLHVTRIGGGFGRRLMNDYVCEVAAIARQVDAPVKLQWSREDDMAHDFYRPAGFHALRASLDTSGSLSGWHDHFITFTHDGKAAVRGGDMRAGEFPEGLIDDYKVMQTLLPLGTACGPWRSPRSNGIAFAVQSFIHELATAANRDHVEFLLDILGEPRWLDPGNPNALNTGRAAAVIKLAAEKAGWGQPLPEGRGLGLAFYFSHAGHVAEIADVSVDADRKLTVHRVTVAGDVGPIVNMSGAENQCQGSVMDGLSATLGQQITIEDGRAQESNFHQYPIMRMHNAPRVDVHFIQSDYPPTGLGEPALPPLAPAICNAIFAASGHRVRSLPLSAEGIKV
jgi:isoquinoline 1-oxidoreductase beta subunit